MSILDDLYDWVIVIKNEEKRDNMTNAESHESIQYTSLPETRV